VERYGVSHDVRIGYSLMTQGHSRTPHIGVQTKEPHSYGSRTERSEPRVAENM
jgi:hypothetical protein